MNEPNDIVKELKELQSPLADMPRSMPYTVPKGYFALLEESVMAGVAAKEDYAIVIQNKAMPYEVPQGYFENFSHTVAHNIEKKQTKEPAYIVPEGYFEQFPAGMLEKVKQEQTRPEKKTIPLWKNVAWAAAAVLLLSIGFEIYKATTVKETISIEQQLAQLPNGTINEYVQANIDEFDTELIASNVTNNNAQPTPAQLEEEEIINYLNETGWDGATIN